MKNIEFFKNKKVTIVGFARSGLCCANLLFDLGAKVAITDAKSKEELKDFISALKSDQIILELSGHTKELIQASDIVVISPGVPSDALPIQWAKEINIPVFSEIEVAFILSPAHLIAVTGAVGKTTVTTLIGEIIKASGKNSVVCGNIGNPFTGEVQKLKDTDYVVLEVSSFQLENIRSFKPEIAVVTNIISNHLDRYNSMQDYIDAKKRIYLNQDKSDYLVLNQDDSILNSMAKETKSKVMYFKNQKDFNPNQSAVLAVGEILGIDKKVCTDVFAQFKGIEHRMEFVEEIKGIRFINDSKATTVESAMWALSNIDKPIIWIAGGKHKGIDYSIIRDLAKKKVKELIVIGQAKNLIKEALKDVVTITEAIDMKTAVELSFKAAQKTDVVVLSPMCASYDMFKDYEDRGRIFKKIVKDLAAKQQDNK